MSIVAVLGAGKVGTAIARAAVAAGHDVRLAASGSPAEIELLARVTAPGALARNAAEAVEGSDLVVLSLPLRKHTTLNPALLRGRIVIDTMNHWEPTDGPYPELAASGVGSSELVARHLGGARLVKSLNHLTYHELDGDARPAGDPERRTLAVAADDPDASARAAAFVESLGFDVEQLPSLAAGRTLEPGGELFAVRRVRGSSGAAAEDFAASMG